jgi:serine protease Do
VQIFVNDRAVAWGMIVAAEGYIVTKASSLTGEPVVCRVLEKDYPAKVLERNETHDLALLQIAERELTPVNWKAAAEMPLGTLLLTRSPQGGVLQVSVVSVEQCSIPAEVPDHSPTHQHGFLGIELKPDAKRPQISRVLPNTAAKEHGLQVGDTLHSVNGQKIDAGSELIELLRQHRPGDAVKLEIERAGKQQSLELKLGTVPSDRWAESLEFAPWNHSSGGISVRSYPFPAVITHDGFIAPQHCGGPVYDLHGHLVGLNIARVDRTATYLLPTHVLQPVVAQMLAKMR